MQFPELELVNGFRLLHSGPLRHTHRVGEAAPMLFAFVEDLAVAQTPQPVEHSVGARKDAGNPVTGV